MAWFVSGLFYILNMSVAVQFEFELIKFCTFIALDVPFFVKMCVCVCVCARAHVCACVCVCVFMFM